MDRLKTADDLILKALQTLEDSARAPLATALATIATALLLREFLDSTDMIEFEPEGDSPW